MPPKSQESLSDRQKIFIIVMVEVAQATACLLWQEESPGFTGQGAG